jgi:CheY-like chemotaxis protein
MKDYKTILTIENDNSNRQLLNHILKKEYEVLSTTKPSEAKTKLETNSIDLIIMDVAFPKENGFMFTKALKNNQQYQDIPIIIVTGYVSTENRTACLEAGCDEYIPRPFERTQLLKTIKKYI